jgi:hypothetical protein
MTGSFPLAELGLNNYGLVKQGVALLFVMDVLLYLPFFYTLFGPAYHPESVIRNRWMACAVAATWLLAAVALAFPHWSLAGALVLVVFHRYFYISSRYQNLVRGAGAVGVMPYLMALYFLLFELSFRFDDSAHTLTRHLYWLFRIDFALILINAGLYKALAGFIQNEGFEYALANPMWSHLDRFFKRLRPANPWLKAQNYVACLSEVLAGLLLLIPGWEAWGGWLCLAIFAAVLFTLRLAQLPLLMMIVPLLFVPELGWPHPSAALGAPSSLLAGGVVTGLVVFIYVYIALLVVTQLVHFINYFGRVNLPPPWQRWHNALSARVPIILWRVFTADATNFFIRLDVLHERTGVATPLTREDTTYSYRRWTRMANKLRFLHVGESVVLSCIFTALKYFRSNRDFFTERILRYARTLTRHPDETVRFQYVSIRKGDREFEYVPISNFFVNPARGEVREERIHPELDCTMVAPHSPVRESVVYGAYSVKTPGAA